MTTTPAVLREDLTDQEIIDLLLSDQRWFHEVADIAEAFPVTGDTDGSVELSRQDASDGIYQVADALTAISDLTFHEARDYEGVREGGYLIGFYRDSRSVVEYFDYPELVGDTDLAVAVNMARSVIGHHLHVKNAEMASRR